MKKVTNNHADRTVLHKTRIVGNADYFSSYGPYRYVCECGAIGNFRLIRWNAARDANRHMNVAR